VSLFVRLGLFRASRRVFCRWFDSDTRLQFYPERFAQESLGHNSKAVHRAYARKAQVLLPPLEEYERDYLRKVGEFTSAVRSEPVGVVQALVR